MPRIPYIRTTTPEGVDTLMLFVQGQPHVLDAAKHPRFQEIADLAERKHSKEDLPEVEASILSMINAGQQALDSMRQLSERVSTKGGHIYFDGDPLENALTEHILAMIKQGDDTWQAPVNFLENVQANPAKHVRKRLYEWISDRGLALTPEGHVIGYKGVRRTEDGSYLSITSGSNTVYVDGVEHTGYIPNPIGATVTIARSAVDSNRDTECSYGLHVGTYTYASNFAGSSRNVLAVEFNPRDVVAIPKGEGHAKIRTCRYRVLEVAEAPYAGTTYSETAPDSEDGDESCDGCDNHPDDCICDDDDHRDFGID